MNDDDGARYDGIDRVECFVRWSTNRAYITNQQDPPWEMTPDQVTAAQQVYAEWQRQKRVAHVLHEHVRGLVPHDLSLFDLAGLILDAADKKP